MALISNGSMMLLSTNLTTCAMQITDLQMVHKEQWQFLYTTIYCGCQCESADILRFLVGEKTNTHYLRIKCVLQAHHENNAYCVRIKGASQYSERGGQPLSSLQKKLRRCSRTGGTFINISRVTRAVHPLRYTRQQKRQGGQTHG